MYTKKSLPIICYISWCGLGFIRGRNSYKYEKKEIIYDYQMSTFSAINEFAWAKSSEKYFLLGMLWNSTIRNFFIIFFL